MRQSTHILLCTLVLLALVGTDAQVAHADVLRPSITAQAGTMASFSAEISNETGVVHSYDVTATGLPTGMTATFVTDGPVVAVVSAGAHANAQLTVRVDVPAQTRPGRYQGSVVARRDDGATVETPFTLVVENRFSLTISSTARNLTTFSGQPFSFDVTVLNSGAAPVTNVVAALEMPGKWVPLSTPTAVKGLDPGQEAIFHVSVTVPASQVAIKQPVKVRVTSDQVSSPQSTLQVRVQSNPTYLPTALAVVVVALVGAAVYFKRKGRR